MRKRRLVFIQMVELKQNQRNKKDNVNQLIDKNSDFIKNYEEAILMVLLQQNQISQQQYEICKEELSKL